MNYWYQVRIKEGPPLMVASDNNLVLAYSTAFDKAVASGDWNVKFELKDEGEVLGVFPLVMVIGVLRMGPLKEGPGDGSS